MQTLSQSPKDPAFVQDPYPFYDRARALGPLVWWEDFAMPAAFGQAEVHALLRDRRFGRERPAEMPREEPAHLAPCARLSSSSLNLKFAHVLLNKHWVNDSQGFTSVRPFLYVDST